jgi:transcriptional/translational regulatory protein YebC/TACO1
VGIDDLAAPFEKHEIQNGILCHSRSGSQARRERHEVDASQESFREVARALEAKFGEARKAALTWKRKPRSRSTTRPAKLMDRLNEHDDVQNVYANFEISDALVAKMGG